MPSSTKSEIGSAQGSVGYNTGELIPPELQPPRWNIIPNQETAVDELPADLDVTQYVRSVLPITDWVTTEGTILDGILTIPDGTDVSDLEIVVTATNANGDGSSRPFLWRISLPVLPPIDPDNVYEGNNNNRVTINTGAPRNYQTPWRVAFLAYIKEHDQTVRSFVGNTNDFQGGVSATNWYVRLHSDDVLRCNGSNGSTLTTLEYSTIIPEEQWIAITAGWDGVDLWLAVNGVRESMPLAYDPRATHGSFHLLGASRGWLDKAQMSTVIISDNDGEFNLAYPCAEGSGLVALDYSDNRFHGVISNEVIHQKRLAGIAPQPPIWIDQPEDQSTSDDLLPGTYDVSSLVFSEGAITWAVTAPATISAQGVISLDASIGNYELVVTATNLQGSSESDPFTWSIVEGLVPPTINSHPQDSTVVAPQGTSFNVVASHPTGPLFYQWEASDDGVVWVSPETLASDVDVASITTDTLLLNSTKIDQDLPNIFAHPVSRTIAAPNQVQFFCGANHPQGADLFYEWEASDDGGQTWQSPELVASDVNIASITTNLLTLESTEL